MSYDEEVPDDEVPDDEVPFDEVPFDEVPDGGPAPGDDGGSDVVTFTDEVGGYDPYDVEPVSEDPGPLGDRRILLAGAAGLAVLAAVIGWVAGQRIQSPAEMAANAAPPAASLLTVPVELALLEQAVVIRGTVSPSDETSIVATSVDGVQVVTAMPKAAGDPVEEGDVLVEVGGRPVIALQGDLPAFRDLVPGLRGPEIRQFEEALVRLGYDPGVVDDEYSAKTAAAVDRLYRDRGYEAPEADDALADAVDLAESAVQTADDELAAAQAALSGAEGGSSPPTTSAPTASRLQQVRAEAARAKAAAAEATRNAERAYEDARTAYYSGVGTFDDLLDAARAVDAARQAEAAVIAEQDELVRRAEQNASVATTTTTTAPDPTAPDDDLDELRAAVTAAERKRAEANRDLAEARGRLGRWMPAAEVQFFDALPLEVSRVFAERGDTPVDAVLTVSGSATLIESAVAGADRSLISEGARATLTAEEVGVSFDAEVSYIDAEADAGPTGEQYAIRLTPLDDVPDEAFGVSFRIAIPVTSSGGEVMAVPLAALSAGADGTARVEVERSPGSTEVLKVATGLRAQGLVEITPVDGSLAPGDRVVVGREGSTLEPYPDADPDADGETDQGQP
ncbi:MAG: peptidoglycan-binding protein [Actinomycetota bacterium]